MHILYLTPQYHPVRSPFIREPAQALVSRGHRIGVLVTSLYGPGKLGNLRKLNRADKLHAYTDDSVNVIDGQAFKWRPAIAHESFPLARSQQMLAQYIKQYGRPDLIHAHCALPCGALAYRLQQQAGKLTGGIPYVITEHSSIYAQGLVRPGWLKGRYLRRARQAFSEAAARIAVSPALAHSIEKVCGNVGRIASIPNSVPQHFFSGGPSDPKAKRPKAAADNFTLLSIALLRPVKGIAELLHAFAQAFADRPGIRLRIGGDGGIRLQLEELARQLKIDKQVTFLGMLERDRVRQEMAQAHAYVLPSRFETFGLVLAEALACGTPLIASKSGGPESIVTQDNGLLVEMDTDMDYRQVDVPALARAMQSMIERYGRYSPSAIQARSRELYSEEVVVDQVESVYHRVLSAGL